MMSRLLGVIRYEFVMNWRRFGLRVVALSLLLMANAGVLIYSASEREALALLEVDTLSLSMQQLVGFLTFPLAYVVIGFMLPVLLAESVPLDKQIGVNELLESLPLSQVAYLSGKVIGALLGVWLVVAFAALINGLLWRAALGTLSLSNHAVLWLVVAFLALMNGGFGILLAATQSTRRRAAVLVIGALILSGILLNMGGAVSGDPSQATLWMALNPTRFPIMAYFVAGQGGTQGWDALRQLSHLLSIGILEICLLGVGVWAWRRWQIARA